MTRFGAESDWTCRVAVDPPNSAATWAACRVTCRVRLDLGSYIIVICYMIYCFILLSGALPHPRTSIQLRFFPLVTEKGDLPRGGSLNRP